MKSAISVAGSMEEPKTNTKTGKELNIFNLNNKILKSRSQRKHRVPQLEDGRIPKNILAHNPVTLGTHG
jgi:hypothetical protein